MRLLVLLLTLLPIAVLCQEKQTQSITIKRSACDGYCPIYSMTVFADGTYFWVGEDYVNKKGYFYGKMDANTFEKARQLLNAAGYSQFRNQYFSISDGCKQIATDNPTVYINVQTSVVKNISHYLGCRGFDRDVELQKLENQLDEVFKTEQWISKH